MTQRTHACRSRAWRGGARAATWTGVRLADLLDLVDAPADARSRVRSLQQRGAFASTRPGPLRPRRPTLLALRLNGEDLVLDHGYPCRLIAPNRPGVFQTKWVTRIEVMT